MNRKVLITGASGLLGCALVTEFLENDFIVLAQYRSQVPEELRKHSTWLQADFSDLKGIRDFLQRNRTEFANCGFLVNNYGPITNKKLPELKGEDFQRDYHHNAVTAFEISDFFVKHCKVESVVNIGFEFNGEMRTYKKIVTYASAKNALVLMTQSFKHYYPEVRFQIIPVPTLEGARVGPKSMTRVSPGTVARDIFR
ncbi:MAG: SDR family oxidoreductase, partial [bacterium]|nr:SDR family oxidoreductase [bacterium]